MAVLVNVSMLVTMSLQSESHPALPQFARVIQKLEFPAVFKVNIIVMHVILRHVWDRKISHQPCACSVHSDQ